MFKEKRLGIKHWRGDLTKIYTYTNGRQIWFSSNNVFKKSTLIRSQKKSLKLGPFWTFLLRIFTRKILNKIIYDLKKKILTDFVYLQLRSGDLLLLNGRALKFRPKSWLPVQGAVWTTIEGIFFWNGLADINPLLVSTETNKT